MKTWTVPLGIIAGSLALLTGPALAQTDTGTGTGTMNNTGVGTGTGTGTMNNTGVGTGTGTGTMDQRDNRGMDNRNTEMNNTRTMEPFGATDRTRAGAWDGRTGHIGWRNTNTYNSGDYKPGYGENPLTSLSLPRVDTRNNRDVASTLAGTEWRLHLIGGREAMNYPNTKLKFNSDGSQVIAVSTLRPRATNVTFEGNRMSTGVVQVSNRFTDNQSDPGGESYRFLKGIETARAVEMRGNHLLIHSYGLPRPLVFERADM